MKEDETLAEFRLRVKDALSKYFKEDWLNTQFITWYTDGWYDG